MADQKRFVADVELGVIHDTERHLYAPFAFEILALLTGETPEDVAAAFSAHPEKVRQYHWLARWDLEGDDG